MNLDASSIMAAMLIGCVGMGLFIFGKKQRRWPQLVVGVTLMVFPYFVPSALAMVVIAGALLGGMGVAIHRDWC